MEKNMEFGKVFIQSQREFDMKELLSMEKKLVFLIIMMIPKPNQ